MDRRENAIRSVLIAVFGTGAGGTAVASETASATISSSSLGGGEFHYNIALTNTSSDSSQIETFWFAWVPGSDFMRAKPTSITEPTGWSANITGSDSSSDGNAIQWATSANPLSAGDVDDFSFESTETLSQLLGPSPYGTNPVETTSFVYHGAPISDSGFKFSVAAVPEPTSLSLAAACCAGLIIRRRQA